MSVSKRLTNGLLSSRHPLPESERKKFVVEVMQKLKDKMQTIDGLSTKKNYKSYDRVATYLITEPILDVGKKWFEEFTVDLVKHYTTKFNGFYAKKFENAKNEDEKLNHTMIQQLAFFLKLNEYVMWKNENHVEIVQEFLENIGDKKTVNSLREDIKLLRLPKHVIKTKNGDHIEILDELFELMTAVEKYIIKYHISKIF